MSTVKSSNSWLSSQYVNGIYIPSGLLLLGIAIVRAAWIPYAAAVVPVLGSWKIYRNRNSLSFFWFKICLVNSVEVRLGFFCDILLTKWLYQTGVQKSLKADVFQEFKLKEKTIVSHNVTM